MECWRILFRLARSLVGRGGHQGREWAGAWPLSPRRVARGIIAPAYLMKRQATLIRRFRKSDWVFRGRQCGLAHSDRLI